MQLHPSNQIDFSLLSLTLVYFLSTFTRWKCHQIKMLTTGDVSVRMTDNYFFNSSAHTLMDYWKSLISLSETTRKKINQKSWIRLAGMRYPITSKEKIYIHHCHSGPPSVWTQGKNTNPEKVRNTNIWNVWRVSMC